LLGSHELWIIDEAVFVAVVRLEDRVDHVDQLVVLEDLCLRHGLPTLVVVVRLVMPMDQRFDQFTTIQLVVVVCVVHLEIVKL